MQVYKVNDKILIYNNNLYVIDLTKGIMITNKIAKQFNVYCSIKKNYISASRGAKNVNRFLEHLIKTENNHAILIR